MNINSDKKVSILIFASGNGSNAENIIKYFQEKYFNINWIIITNNANAGVIQKSIKMDIPFLVFGNKDFYENKLLDKIEEINPILIILAGFLLKIPENLIRKFPKKIINIHPSLLPKYGGKGMYGMNVHKEVIKNKEDQSGISIHYVNNQYDDGKIIFQKSTKIIYPSTAEKLAKKIHELEMKYFPEVIEKLIDSEYYE